MTQILHVTDGIYAGGADAVEAVEFLRGRCIKHVLKLYISVDIGDAGPGMLPLMSPFSPPHKVTWPGDFRVYDNAVGEILTAELLRNGVTYLRDQVAMGNHVLIAASADWTGRCAVFAAGYAIERGADLREFFCRRLKKFIFVSFVRQHWETLLSAYNTPYTWEDVVSWTRLDD